MSAVVAASETEVQEPVRVTIYGGIGLGELIHLDLGWLVTPKWHVEWRIGNIILVPLTNVCKESKSSPRLNCVESATCESQQ